MLRKHFLQNLGLAGLSGGLFRTFLADEGTNEAFRFVHLTDSHVFDRRAGYEGYAKCVRSVNGLNPEPDFVMMGGDMVFDGMYNEKQDYIAWMRRFKELSDELDMPWYPSMGNHDPYGWSSRRKSPADDPDLGKAMILNEFEWEAPYYSFDHKGWHFTVLDCIAPVEKEDGLSYAPMIDVKQLEWLAKDLGAAADKPKIVVVHVALFYLGHQAQGDKQSSAVSSNMHVQNNKEVREILERHGVKLVLQGHCHHLEFMEYNGVKYLTSGAASGAWWAGNWKGNEEGFSVIHCNSDGTLSWSYQDFGWTAQLDDADTLERERKATYDAFQAEQARLRAKERG